MNAIDKYREEIAAVFEEASREMEGLPDEFRGLGQTLLAKSNPLANGGSSNLICFLLPYWMREVTGAPEALCRDLAVGNLFAMLHYFVLDDAMDGQEGRSPQGLRKSLALGQLMHGMYRRRYTSHFPHDSSLWTFERAYEEQWAIVVGGEGSEAVEPRDIARLAGKAAPVKLCATGVLHGSGQTERVRDIEQAVDLALAILQLSDDLEDWREDLADERRNAFLTLVRNKLALAESEPLTEPLVKRAIYRLGCVSELAAVAAELGTRLREIPNVPGSLLAFGEAIEREIRDYALEIDEAVEELAAGGGISRLFARMIEK